ncbi:hypothetical protein KJW39_06990 [Streptococcus lutetiensis]|uniref:hypothetical protein n=1 Tax=Streptococcus lutetiensis TaxID=150055 RepID=UPI001BDCF2BF|nr:hypothetical protein [Streptococcus lutetiensis]MBT1057651.1 hypothetical protein [Streptococcus lutetiensis]
MEGFTPDITDFNLLKFERVGYWSFSASSFFYFWGVGMQGKHVNDEDKTAPLIQGTA